MEELFKRRKQSKEKELTFGKLYNGFEDDNI
jgi:hypothetical protein